MSIARCTFNATTSCYLKRTFHQKRELETYIRSSDAAWRWKLDFPSLTFDESDSGPCINSIFPKCKMAATTRNIASCSLKTSEDLQWKQPLEQAPGTRWSCDILCQLTTRKHQDSCSANWKLQCQIHVKLDLHLDTLNLDKYVQCGLLYWLVKKTGSDWHW